MRYNNNNTQQFLRAYRVLTVILSTLDVLVHLNLNTSLCIAIIIVPIS